MIKMFSFTSASDSFSDMLIVAQLIQKFFTFSKLEYLLLCYKNMKQN